MAESKKFPIDNVVAPVQKFIQQEKSGGLVLGISVILAIIMANSPLSDFYSHFFEHELGFVLNDSVFKFTLHHWINDGLMSVFFFVVGLELKREIVAGELSNLKKAFLPIAAAVGGMIVPAIIYYSLNSSGDVRHGWGIPMATDIAFALGVLFILGNKIPLSLKIFLTALAIVDDLGAVLVIAFFYTSDISLLCLSIGIAILLVMYLASKIGVRSILFYAILGIAGVWTAFLLSGVHATIAAVLAAFTIPADVKIAEDTYIRKIHKYLNKFKDADSDSTIPTLTNQQLHILDHVKKDTNEAIPPLQQLEHSMHPFVSFFIIPVFALANAGVSFLDIEPEKIFNNNVALGVSLGLLAGKVIGIVGFSLFCVKFRIATFPQGVNIRNLFGLAFLGSIGFTMSMFITSLAFHHKDYMIQAKIGIFIASIIGGIIGYLILNKQFKKAENL